MAEVSWGRAVAVLASCAVHAGIVVALPRAGRASEPTAEHPVWMELVVSPAPREPAATRVAPAEPDAPEVHDTAPPRRSARRSITESPAPLLEPTRQVVDAPAPVAPRTPIDLSPLAAARTLGDSTFPERDASVPPSDGAQSEDLAQQVPGLRASKARSLAGAAADLVEDGLYDALRPWKLLSRTTHGGSAYRYTGGGFDAEILPDGRVLFHEKDGPAGTARATKTQEFGPGSALPPGVTFELNVGDPRALWQRLRGKDPHAAERRLFLERTRELRDHLAGRTPH